MKRISFVLGIVLTLGTTPASFTHAQSANATMRLSPSSAALDVGARTTIRLVVNSPTQYINAAEATISFPASRLRVTSLSKSGSIFSLWAAEPSYSNSSGRITFSGGRPSPGYRGSGGTVLSITFEGRTAGTAAVTVSGAQVLANDGEGTNILGGTSGTTITVKTPTTTTPEPEPETPNTPAPTITSSSHPDATKVSTVRDIRASWTGGTGVRGYSVVFNQTASTVPPEQSVGTTATFSRTAVTDGTWYLHVRAQYAEGWSSTARYTFKIDTTAPAPFAITTAPGTTTGSVTLTFASTDAGGIQQYQLQIDGEPAQTVTSPHTLSGLATGVHQLLVTAYDQAGNVATATAQVEITAPPAAIAVLGAPVISIQGTAQPTIMLGEALVVRGAAPAGSIIHIVVRSEESVFEFPLEEIIDQTPVEPAPAGLTAWKVELYPALTPGQHEVVVDVRDAEGNITATAPTLKFRVIPPSLRVGSTYIPLRTLVLVLGVLAAVLLIGTVVFCVLWRRARRALNQKKVAAADKAKGIVY